MHAELPRPMLLQQSDIRWASRWDTYLLMTDDQIHWFSIINSLMIVLFLSGMVAMIMMRTLHRDISKCAAPCALAHCAACAAVRRAGCLVPLRILLHMHVLEACTHAAAGTTSWRQRRRRRRRPAGSWYPILAVTLFGNVQPGPHAVLCCCSTRLLPRGSDRELQHAGARGCVPAAHQLGAALRVRGHR